MQDHRGSGPGAAQEAHAGDQSDQSEIMIPVQVGDENMVDPASPDLVFVHLRLGAFSAINQEKMIVEGDHLGSRDAGRKPGWLNYFQVWLPRAQIGFRYDQSGSGTLFS